MRTSRSGIWRKFLWNNRRRSCIQPGNRSFPQADRIPLYRWLWNDRMRSNHLLFGLSYLCARQLRTSCGAHGSKDRQLWSWEYTWWNFDKRVECYAWLFQKSRSYGWGSWQGRMVPYRRFGYNGCGRKCIHQRPFKESASRFKRTEYLSGRDWRQAEFHANGNREYRRSTWWKTCWSSISWLWRGWQYGYGNPWTEKHHGTE